MESTAIDVAVLSMDEFGRVVLSDDILRAIEGSENFVSAGAANRECGGANGGCTNNFCDGSSNGSCSNTLSCVGSGNLHCALPGEWDPDQ